MPDPDTPAAGGDAPVVPEVDRALLAELHRLAVELRERKPWQTFEECDWIGLRDAGSGRLGVISILGGEGLHFSVQLYLPDGGIRFWNRFLHGEDPDPAVALQDLEMVECSFGSKDEAEPTDLERTREFCGQLKGNRRSAVVLLRATRPEHFPWFPDESESRQLADALRVALRALTELPSRFDEFYDADPATGLPVIPIYELPPGGDRTDPAAWSLSSGPFPLAPPRELPPVPENEVFAARMAALPVRKKVTWEVASYFLPAPVFHQGRPVMPSVSLLLRGDVNQLAAPVIGQPSDSRAELLQRVFAAAASEAGFLPATLRVASPLAERAFAGLAATTGLRVAPQRQGLRRLETAYRELLGQLDSLGEALLSGAELEPELEPEPELTPPPKPGQAELFDEFLEPAPPGPEPRPAKARYQRPRSRDRFVLRIDLHGAKPPIWRRLDIPTDASFFDLHVAIQDAMGWSDEHLHGFQLLHGRELLGLLSWDADDTLGTTGPGSLSLRELDTRLNQVIGSGRDFTLAYIYDWGDHWEHRIKLEKVVRNGPANPMPRLLAGRGACPPEDCGGLPGYYALREGNVEEEEFDADFLREIREARFDAAEVVFTDPRAAISRQALMNGAE